LNVFLPFSLECSDLWDVEGSAYPLYGNGNTMCADLRQNDHRDCILVFLRYPEIGRVKTRLSADIGDFHSSELYRCFVLDLLSTIKRLEWDLVLCVAPGSSIDKFHEWLGSEYVYAFQQGDDLGQRMKNSFVDIFSKGYERAVLIGSDIPDLPLDIIHEAFGALGEKDSVIGPAGDGGYYLIGFRGVAFLEEAFEGMRWGTDGVFSETVCVLNRFGIAPHMLPEWYDVDTLDDLFNLVERSKGSDFRFSKTIAYVSRNLDSLMKRR
jgi:rSAM/selenodomain-associated transferase 1